MNKEISHESSRTLVVGQGVLTITSDDFLNGYQAGQLAYTAQYHARALTDDALRTIIIDQLSSLDYPELFSVGFTVGLIVALASRKPAPPEGQHA